MSDAVESLTVIILTALFGCLLIIILFLWKGNRKEQQSDERAPNDSVEDLQKKSEKKIEVSKTKKKVSDRRWIESKSIFSHNWLVSTLKGHAGAILTMDFSANEKYLISCSEDRSVLLWLCRDFTQKEHKSVKVNVEFDHATQVKWSPDSKAFIINKANGNCVQVYKVSKKSDGSLGNVVPVLEFPKLHQVDIINIGIACNGKFIMTCSNDTSIIIWNLKGEVLANLDTHQGNNSYACVSPCGRFVASSGFTPDVKVWEVIFEKNGGEFKQVSRAFELKGHRAGVYSFAFNNDSTRMATVSKDGTWKLWDTKIEYEKGQEPYLIMTGQLKLSEHSLIALSPDGRAVAVATKANIYCFSGVTGKLQYDIEDSHTNDISSVQFSPDGKYILASVGRHIRIFHNVVGYQATVEDLMEKKIEANNQTLRDRIEKQIQEARQSLQVIGITN